MGLFSILDQTQILSVIKQTALKSLAILICFSFFSNASTKQNSGDSKSSKTKSHDPLLNDFVSNDGDFKPDLHYINRYDTRNSAHIVINHFGWPRNRNALHNPLQWSYVQPKLVNSNTAKDLAMDSFERSMELWSKAMIFHFFAVAKILQGFSAKDKKMIETKWGLEFADSKTKQDYVELNFKEGKTSPRLYTITVNHKLIKDKGSLNAYFRHRGFNFSPPKVDFTFQNKIQFQGHSKDRLFNQVFNFLSNDYSYMLGNAGFKNVSIVFKKTKRNCTEDSQDIHSACLQKIKENISTFKQDWKRIYNYTLGDRSKEFIRTNVIAGHTDFKKIVSANRARKKEEAQKEKDDFFAKNYKFFFNKGSIPGAEIGGEEYHIIEGILIPKRITKINTKKKKREMFFEKSAVFYKAERDSWRAPWTQGSRLTGTEVYNHFKTVLKNFESLNEGLSTTDGPGSQVDQNQLQGSGQSSQVSQNQQSQTQEGGQSSQVSQNQQSQTQGSGQSSQVSQNQQSQTQGSGQSSQVSQNQQSQTQEGGQSSQVSQNQQSQTQGSGQSSQVSQNQQSQTQGSGQSSQVSQNQQSQTQGSGQSSQVSQNQQSQTQGGGQSSQVSQNQQSQTQGGGQSSQVSQNQQSQTQGSGQSSQVSQNQQSQTQEGGQSSQVSQNQQSQTQEGGQGSQVSQNQQSQQPTVQQLLQQQIQQQAQQSVQEIQQISKTLSSPSQPADSLQTESLTTTALNQEQNSAKEPKYYEFSFVKKETFNGQMFGLKFYADIEGLYVLYDSIKSLIGKTNTYKIKIPNKGVYYRVKHIKGKGYVRGEKLTGKQAFDYLKEKLSNKAKYSFKQY